MSEMTEQASEVERPHVEPTPAGHLLDHQVGDEEAGEDEEERDPDRTRREQTIRDRSGPARPQLLLPVAFAIGMAGDIGKLNRRFRR
jgi:hypothetical protein